MRCGKCVSRACTLDLAPVQVRAPRDTILSTAKFGSQLELDGLRELVTVAKQRFGTKQVTLLGTRSAQERLAQLAQERGSEIAEERPR